MWMRRYLHEKTNVQAVIRGISDAFYGAFGYIFAHARTSCE